MANLTTLSSGSSVTLTVTDQQTIVLNNGLSDKARLQVATGPGAGAVVADNHRGRRVYGPFGAGTVTLSAVSGDVRYELSGDSSSPLADDAANFDNQIASLLAALPVTSTWANRAALVSAGTTTAFFTDVGVGGGSVWTYSGGRWRPYAGQVVLKNLTSSVTQTTTTRAVMDFCTLPAGLWQDGDILECRFYKAMTTGTDTDTTESAIGTGSGTFGTSLGLSTAALTNTNPVLSAIWRWRRVSNTTIRHAGIGGATGLGSAGALLSDITASVPDMDGITTYPQLSGVLTTGAGAVSSLRACTWTLIAGA